MWCGAGRDAATAPGAGDCAFCGRNACRMILWPMEEPVMIDSNAIIVRMDP